jgi:hypothetical protein
VVATNLVPMMVVPIPPIRIITMKLMINLVLREKGALSLARSMIFISYHLGVCVRLSNYKYHFLTICPSIIGTQISAG